VTILHVHTDLVGGGIEQMMVTLATHTRAAEVAICWCPASHPEPPPDMLRAITEAGVTLHRIPPPFLSPAYPLRLARLVAELRPDVLHLHGGTIGCLGALLGRICRVPAIIYTEHLPCHPLRKDQAEWCHAPWIRSARFATAGMLDLTAAISANVAASLPRTTGTAEVVHNGVNLSVYQAAISAEHRERKRRELGVHSGDCLLVGVGNLTERKSYGTAIGALAASRLSTGRCVLAVCGEGQERTHLEDVAADLGVAGELRLLGWRNDVANILQSADLFVHPARDEGFGLVVVEAAAAGLPIVASEVGGIPEIIQHGVNGLLVPPGDPQALAQAIQKLIDDPQMARSLGDAARQTAFERFSAEAMAAAYMDLYSQLLSDRD